MNHTSRIDGSSSVSTDAPSLHSSSQQGIMGNPGCYLTRLFSSLAPHGGDKGVPVSGDHRLVASGPASPPSYGINVSGLLVRFPALELASPPSARHHCGVQTRIGSDPSINTDDYYPPTTSSSSSSSALTLLHQQTTGFPRLKFRGKSIL